MTRHYVSLYLPNNSTLVGSITLEQARELKREGFAEWTKRCKAVRLLHSSFDFRGLSCKPTPETSSFILREWPLSRAWAS